MVQVSAKEQENAGANERDMKIAGAKCAQPLRVTASGARLSFYSDNGCLYG